MLAPPPPLQPSGDEGRSLLRRELLRSEYHDQHLFQRLRAWLGRLFDHTTGATAGSHGATAFVTMLVVVLLLLGLVLLLSRLRRDRARRTSSAAVLPDDRPSAAELRRRADTALAEGRHDDALVDGYRALALRQIERGRLGDQPGATAHEVAVRLSDEFPHEGRRVGRSADLFDATLYGDRPATREDAAEVLGLDDTLAGSR